MTRKTVREALVLLTLSLLLGFSYNAVVGKGIFDPDPYNPRSTMSQADLPSAEIVSPEQARQLFEAGEATFVDTRHAFDFDLGHIPGAVSIPLKQAETLVSELSLAKDRPIVVYCDGAECNSSFEVSSVFIMEGYTDVRIFFSGWQVWKDMGYETEGTDQ